MTDSLAPTHRWARWAGLGYLVIIVTGIYSEFAVRSSLLVRGDAAATAANISASELFYRSSIASEFLMLAADVFVAGALLVVFRGASRGLALLAAFFRLTHASIVAVNLLNVYVPLLLLNDPTAASAIGEEQRHAFVLLFLQAHGYGYAIGLVFFGIYCAIIGTLVLRSGYVPRVLGVLLFAAAAGYLSDSLARTFLVDYSAYENVLGMVVLLPAFVAELAFSLWLMLKGVNTSTSMTASTSDPSG